LTDLFLSNTTCRLNTSGTTRRNPLVLFPRLSETFLRHNHVFLTSVQPPCSQRVLEEIRRYCTGAISAQYRCLSHVRSYQRIVSYIGGIPCPQSYIRLRGVGDLLISPMWVRYQTPGTSSYRVRQYSLVTGVWYYYTIKATIIQVGFYMRIRPPSLPLPLLCPIHKQEP